MKKLYLLLLVLLLLFIPATNAVTPYQLDHPIRELNNHTLREVFEDGNLFIYENVTYSAIPPIYFGDNIWVMLENTDVDSSQLRLNMLDTNKYYDGNYYFRVDTRNDNTSSVDLYSGYDIFSLNAWDDFLTTNANSKSSYSQIYTYVRSNITPSDRNRIILTTNMQSTLDIIKPLFINLTMLGIDNLTVEQMDMYYDYYLKAVQFEIDYYEAGLDPGEYQHIFKSILNGVKNLISEMGYVWQWLNAPIITTDMQDYSFNIDWSWDLIGVIRQIMNSAGILTLQIAFWVPSLAFAFMGIPVQISVLSLLFSNLIFLLLGWILVKSLLI